MSSAPNKSRQSSKSASSPEPKTDVQPDSVSQPPSSEENAMDQPLESTLTAVPPNPPAPPKPPNPPAPPAPPNPSETMSSTASSSPDPTPDPTPTPDATPTPAAVPSTDETTAASAPAADELADAQAAARLQPIPPASEPMQYRAIGLIRGKYTASDEQFTRGAILTEDGYEIGAVLLGRVMSLVKKHVDLEEPHLWVVYPRTREKGDGDLHVQVVGVWEPENLNRMDDASEPEADESDESELDDLELDEPELDESELADAALDESELDESELDESELDESELDDAEPELTDAALDESRLLDADEAEAEPEPSIAQSVEALAPEESGEAAVSSTLAEAQSHPSDTEENTPPPIPATDLDDKYFSVRGEVVYQSIEDQQILVKIRRVPRPGTDESKSFKVVLKGTLEGKAVGYFWDLHVQREGNMLVVQEGTMVAAVPPQKRGKKPPFNKRGSGGGYRGGGRPAQGGGPRKPWQNREGQLPRPSRSGDRSDRPTPPPPNRENRTPSPRPIKRRNPEKPEG